MRGAAIPRNTRLPHKTMSAPQLVLDLVERFTRNRETYCSAAYNEAQLRQEFVNPFFKALGWDMDNAAGYAEAYKDVVHEDALKIGGTTKAPDYSFRIGGTRKFFLETKKPAVNISQDIAPAFQLRRYGFTAKLPLSILTDFEEFAVYDCRVKPDKTDKPGVARVLHIPFADYAPRWDEIANLFSPEAIRRGAFDAFATQKRTRGTLEVDAAFLQEIEGWRATLARHIATRNPQLSERELRDAVERIIDRIIFLRICEDRGIEPDQPLHALRNGANVYARLVDLWHRADDRYNSGLFHFRAHKSRDEAPDEITPQLHIDDKPLKEILARLYYPDSPYAFDIMPLDILGQAYEQFLGKVIRLHKGKAIVEDKPEVKKAGGVFYTPGYIVEAIVRQTVGALCEGKTPAQVAKLKILDPACGSGSFLLGAYSYLLDWHLKYYTEHDPDKAARGRTPPIYRAAVHDPTAAGPTWRLTASERKRILLNNIFGVDIDAQAVEVTKLSLLLKVLEGESEETLQAQMRLLQERALPDLGRNIKRGNSLIESDFYDQIAMSLLDEDEHDRVFVFDWKGSFPEVMQAGGFDAVIGNPPYIRIQAMKEWVPLEVEHLKQKYKAASQGNYDIYVVFVERALQLLNARGQLGFILPSKFLTTDYGAPLRQLLANRRAVTKIVDFRHEQVFTSATTYTCLLFASATPTEKVLYSIVSPPQLLNNFILDIAVESNLLSSAPWTFRTSESKNILDKIQTESLPLLELPTKIARGSSTGDDDIFMLRVSENAFTTRTGEVVEIEEDILRIPIYATDFGRYVFRPKSRERLVFPYVVESNRYFLLSQQELKHKFPNAYSYLSKHKKILEKRKQYSDWFSFSAPRNLDVHNSAHLVVPLLANKGLYCKLPLDMHRYCLMASGGFSISLSNQSNLLPHYILGLLNSTLLFWCLSSISNIFRGGWITCTKQYVGTLPIRAINFDDKADTARHDKMVELVETMLQLHRQHAAASGHQQENLARRIEVLDRQINRLVYELYDLSEAEIALVEAGH
jgi:adenine-specific DNA methylase